jgi:formylglycine-generating enzyme required for sulfatase activity
MVFHTVAPGKFMMGEVGKQIETEITKPFQMAATQTTQIVWRKVALRAKERFPGKYDALNADPSRFEGDLRPVEQISWEDIQLWLSALNELAVSGDVVVEVAMPGHKPGEIYRLPTEAEWEFVVRARGEAPGKYHFGENEKDLADFAWFGGNSEHQTHPVAQKKPLVVDGQEFYDMHGNVSEWMHDWYGINLQGGIDPRGPDGGDAYAMRGGGWSDGAPSILRSGCRSVGMPDSRYAFGGFRLVRSAR